MSEQTVKLPELGNNVKIVGTLKEVNLEIKPNKKDPKVKQIMGDVVVTVIENNKVHEHKAQLFAKDSSKLFKGYKTIKDTYKPSDVYGTEDADRVSIVGSITGNDFMNGQGELISINKVRGLFVNRIEEKDIMKDASLANDMAVAQLELVVTGFQEITKDDVPTGEYKIGGFTVGYNESVTELKNMVIGADLADAVQSMYTDNSTGKLTFKMNNYVEVVEKKKDGFDEVPGFGVQVDIAGTVEKRVNELRVIGGVPPYYDERALDEDKIKLAKQVRALHLEEVKNAVPAAPPKTQTKPAGGFGDDPFAQPGQTIDIKDDDLPF